MQALYLAQHQLQAHCKRLPTKQRVTPLHATWHVQPIWQEPPWDKYTLCDTWPAMSLKQYQLPWPAILLKQYPLPWPATPLKEYPLPYQSNSVSAWHLKSVKQTVKGYQIAWHRCTISLKFVGEVFFNQWKFSVVWMSFINTFFVLFLFSIVFHSRSSWDISTNLKNRAKHFITYERHFADQWSLYRLLALQIWTVVHTVNSTWFML